MLSEEVVKLDTTTSSIQTQLSGKADSSHSHEISDVKNLQSILNSLEAGEGEGKTPLDYGGIPIVTTSGTGSAYTATVEGITALTKGMKITIIPHVTSTSTLPTLNLNGLGEHPIYMTGTLPTNVYESTVDYWLEKDGTVTLEYDEPYWKTLGKSRPNAFDLNGVISIEHGGTGAISVEGALKNFGIDPEWKTLADKKVGSNYTFLSVELQDSLLNYSEFAILVHTGINTSATIVRPTISVYIGKSTAKQRLADMAGYSTDEVEDTYTKYSMTFFPCIYRLSDDYVIIGNPAPTVSASTSIYPQAPLAGIFNTSGTLDFSYLYFEFPNTTYENTRIIVIAR